MFSTLDRHIARQYLFNVIALMVVLFSFVVMVDVALNIGRFLNRAAELHRDQPLGALRKTVVTAALVVDIWWPRLLQLFNYTIGLGLIGAMGFTFTQLVRHREIVAMLAGGISLFRAIRPVLLVAALMMGVRTINQELVIANPRIAPLLGRDPSEAGKRELGEFQVPPTPDGRRQVLFARKFDPRTATMHGVELWRRNDKGVATSRVSADEARWIAGGANRGWSLTNATVTRLDLGRPGEGGARAGEPAPSMLDTDIEPSTLLFNRFASFSQSLSWAQIGRMLESPQLKPEMREKLQRIRWGRISTMLSAILSLLITMPFFLMREPKNMLVQSLKCAPVGIVSLMGGVLLAAMPVPGLPAGFAVFLPVVILLPVAIAVLSTVRT
ncbi:MAG: LptF/LptG family permease [Phycisphaerales bacterium]|nr:LptF/LptG family permease [Phycisphaerales bacterium]